MIIMDRDINNLGIATSLKNNQATYCSRNMRMNRMLRLSSHSVTYLLFCIGAGGSSLTVRLSIFPVNWNGIR